MLIQIILVLLIYKQYSIRKCAAAALPPGFHGALFNVSLPLFFFFKITVIIILEGISALIFNGTL